MVNFEQSMTGCLCWQVNGKDVRKCSHQEAVMALIAPTHEILLKVRHDPPPAGLQVRPHLSRSPHSHPLIHPPLAADRQICPTLPKSNFSA